MNRENVSRTLVKTISASPGYYAIPELKQTYDLWWNKLSQIFREEGLDNIPNHLSWDFLYLISLSGNKYADYN